MYPRRRNRDDLSARPDKVTIPGPDNKPVECMLAVPNDVYKTLNKTFDTGAKFAYCGKKDGTNRKLIRIDGDIFSEEDGRIVKPIEEILKLKDPECLPVTTFGRYMAENGKIEWAYDDKGNYLGVRAKDGTIITKDKL